MHKLLIIFRTNDSPYNEIFEEKRLLSQVTGTRTINSINNEHQGEQGKDFDKIVIDYLSKKNVPLSNETNENIVAISIVHSTKSTFFFQCPRLSKKKMTISQEMSRVFEQSCNDVTYHSIIIP